MNTLWTVFKYYMMYVTVKKFFAKNPEQLSEIQQSLNVGDQNAQGSSDLQRRGY